MRSLCSLEEDAVVSTSELAHILLDKDNEVNGIDVNGKNFEQVCQELVKMTNIQEYDAFGNKVELDPIAIHNTNGSYYVRKVSDGWEVAIFY